jgi:P-type Ca2+ transporter type 2C
MPTSSPTVVLLPSSLSLSSSLLSYNASSTDASSTLIADLLQQLQVTSVELGLTETQALERLHYYGSNTLIQPPGKSIWRLIAEQFQDRLVQILLLVAMVSALFSILELQQQNNGSSSIADVAATAASVLLLQEQPSAAAAAQSSSSSSSSAITAHDIWHALVEPLIILTILIGNAAVGVWQTASASFSLQALSKLQPTLCHVLRNGQWQSDFSASALVPGDIIEVRVGDKIPADARLLQLSASTLKVDETSLTGESVTVRKLPGDEGSTTVVLRRQQQQDQQQQGQHSTSSSSSSPPQPPPPLQDQVGMLFSGTMVTSGSGLALVVQTGMSTQLGKIQGGVSAAALEQPKTPLAIKLDEFGETLTVLIGLICIAVWIVSIPKFNDPSFGTVWDGAIYYAKVAVALGVAAIPEGLPAVITLCLSLGTRKMAQRNVLVRKLSSVETLGCTTCICTDKTGTLTTNEMTVVSLLLLQDEEEEEEEGTPTAVSRPAKGHGHHTPILMEHVIEGTSYTPIGQVHGIPIHVEIQTLPQGAVADIAMVSALCNNAKIIGMDTTSGGDGTEKTYTRAGEPTEAALCVLAEKLGGKAVPITTTTTPTTTTTTTTTTSMEEEASPLPSVLASAHVTAWRESCPRQATLEFNRDRKSMSVLCSTAAASVTATAQQPKNKKNNIKIQNRLFVKGAPNLLLERCTHVKLRNGSVIKITSTLRRSMEQRLTELAQRPLRCLALAVKDTNQLESSLATFQATSEGDVAHHPLLKDPMTYKDIESGLTLVGFVGIKDPARPEVAESILECTRAGIRVMMITGDARDTAVAIAREVNIFPKQQQDDDPHKPLKAYEGREFFLKTEAEQLEILKEDNIVFCRAEPADKQKLVKMLQQLGEIPAMTGDGVNDAPALQQAAIGVAMGSGTEVAKEAADMVLADDNFSTIVGAVEEGRRIYANMQAFICFLISCNIGEICAIFLATVAGFPEPLTAMHLLWVNLVTDGPPATALGFNPPSPDLMEQPPRPSDEPIMTKWLLTRYCLTGLYVGIATIGVFAQHYLNQGVTLSELARWSSCGETWIPSVLSSADGAGTAAMVTTMCSDLFQGDGRVLPQTLALTTLVCMEMFKALSAVSVDSSLLRVGPQSNPWLLLGVSCPFLLHLLVLYSANLGLPGIGESFGMVR